MTSKFVSSRKMAPRAFERCSIQYVSGTVLGEYTHVHVVCGAESVNTRVFVRFPVGDELHSRICQVEGEQS